MYPGIGKNPGPDIYSSQKAIDMIHDIVKERWFCRWTRRPLSAGTSNSPHENGVKPLMKKEYSPSFGIRPGPIFFILFSRLGQAVAKLAEVEADHFRSLALVSAAPAQSLVEDPALHFAQIFVQGHLSDQDQLYANVLLALSRLWTISQDKS